jgi:hypothetical protein
MKYLFCPNLARKGVRRQVHGKLNIRIGQAPRPRLHRSGDESQQIHGQRDMRRSSAYGYNQMVILVRSLMMSQHHERMQSGLGIDKSRTSVLKASCRQERAQHEPS